MKIAYLLLIIFGTGSGLYAQDIQTVSAGTIYTNTSIEVPLINNTDSALEYRILSACSCLIPARETLVINPGNTESLEVTIDTSRYKGEFSNFIILKSKESSRKLIKITAFIDKDIGDTENCTSCEEVKRQIEHETKLAELSNNSLQIEVRYSGVCRSCRIFSDSFVNSLEDEFAVSLYVKRTHVPRLKDNNEQILLNNDIVFNGEYSKIEVEKSIYDGIYSFKTLGADKKNSKSYSLSLLQKILITLVCLGAFALFLFWIKNKRRR